jgi:DNA-binding transcriptional LysR family regulator
VYETDMAEGLKVMALQGHGIAFLPESAVRKEVQSGALAEAHLPGAQSLALTMEVRAYRAKLGPKTSSRHPAHELWQHLTQETPQLLGG